MFKTIIKHSFRALSKQKLYVIINVIGLAIGIACSLIITLYIINQLSYDQFYNNNDRIYRLVLNGKVGGQELNVSTTSAVIAPTMLNEFPEIEDYTRLNSRGELTIRYNDNYFNEEEFIEADSSFFKIFSIQLLQGEINSVLNEPYTIVLSRTTSEKIFGTENPVNKLLYVDTDTIPYRISGIMEDIPDNSHFTATAISSFMTNPKSKIDLWTSNSFDSYILLNKNTNPEQVNKKIPDLVYKYVGPEVEQYLGITLDDFFSQGNKYNYYLQALTDIHLDPTVQGDLKPTSDPKYLVVFGSIALLIIVVAGINFMNLSTAQASKRAKEVGIKKVSGSPRSTLIAQFFTESMVLTIIALIIATFIVALILPYFNNLLEVHLKLNLYKNWFTIPLLLLLSLFIGLLAGSYPALYLSSFNPYSVLKGKILDSIKKGSFRKVLVVLQFTISIILIIGTIIMFRQIQFMLNKDLGFDKEHLMIIERTEALNNKVKAFKNDILNITGVINASASTSVPGHDNTNYSYMMESRNEETFLMTTNWVDYDYFKTFGIKLKEGRTFNPEYTTDHDACVVNESAIEDFSLKNPFEVRFKSPDGDAGEFEYYPIIGVVNNFNHESLHSKITPYVFRFKNESVNWGFLSIRLSANALKNTIKEIEKIWKEYTINKPIQFFFLDEDFDHIYKQERQNVKLSIISAILALLVASLGLFGLTSYTIQQKTKEIGLRRVYGATVSSIFYLISKETILLVVISMVIACPLVYIVTKNWLQNFYYRIDLSPFDFLSGFLIALLIAILTISYKTLKSARITPSNSLRYE